MWAGFLALANQQAAPDGKPVLGFINPAKYGFAGGASYRTLFHHITVGTSGKFHGTASYDLVTGAGSAKGQVLINALTK